MSAVPTTASSSSPAWRRVKLGEICSKPQYGWTTKARNEGSGLKLLRTTDITSGQIDWSKVPYCTESPPDFEKYLVQEGDILISRAGSVGVSHLVTLTQPSVFASYLIRFRPGPNVLPKYLACFLQSPSYWKQIAINTAGVAVPNVNASKLQEVELPLAPLDAQRRIVAELEKQFSRLDEAVANLKRVKNSAARLVSSVLIDAIAGRLTKNSTRGWRTVKVCEAGQVVLGRQRAPQYLTGRWSQKYLRVANIKDDAIDFSDVETMDFDADHLAKYRLEPGDILVSEGQSPELLGQSAIFRGYDEPLCFQKTLHRFRADPELTIPAFAQIVFRSHVRSGVFRRLGSITTNIGHLTLEKFKAAPFPLPPLDEQHRIVAEVDRYLTLVREVEAAVDVNLTHARALRQAVLTRAFCAAID